MRARGPWNSKSGPSRRNSEGFLEAVHPTIARTNWWLDWTYDEYQIWNNSPYEGWQPCHRYAAVYYNLDFPPDRPPRTFDYRTWMKETTMLCARDEGNMDYWYWWYVGGPYANLLGLQVYKN